MIGLGTRIVKFIVYLMLISWHHQARFILCAMDTFTAATVFLFLWTPCDRSFSVDAILRRMRSEWDGGRQGLLARGPIWGQRLMQFQLSAVYFVALTLKIQGEPWRNGTAVYYLQHLVDFYQLPVPGLMTSWIAVNFATYFTLFVQVCLAFLVWIPGFRLYALLLGLCEHLVMAWNLNLTLFQFFLMAGLIPFLDSSTVERWLKNIRSFLPEGPAIVAYDGHCAFCRAVKAGLEGFDFFNRLVFLDVRDRDKLSHHPQLGERECLERLCLLNSRGTLFSGFEAFRWMVWRLPVCWPVAPFLALPGVSWTGRQLYRWFAKNRFFLNHSGPACTWLIHQ